MAPWTKDPPSMTSAKSVRHFLLFKSFQFGLFTVCPVAREWAPASPEIAAAHLSPVLRSPYHQCTAHLDSRLLNTPGNHGEKLILKRTGRVLRCCTSQAEANITGVKADQHRRYFREPWINNEFGANVVIVKCPSYQIKLILYTANTWPLNLKITQVKNNLT